MARTIPSEKRRIKQVKVNLSVSELKELDKYVAENGSDRSTILRDSFEQFLKLKSTVSEVKNGIERVQSDANKSYTNYPALQDDINTIFSNFIDNNTNINIFSGTKLASTVANNVYNVTFDITVLKKLITKNYSVQFVDTISNTWKNNLFLDDVMTDQVFDMSFNIPSSVSTQLYNSDNENIGEINHDNIIPDTPPT